MSVTRFISRCGNDKFSDGENDFRWHNEANQLVEGVCIVACEGQLQVVLWKDLLTACVIAIWFVVSFDVFGLSCAVRVVVSFDRDFLSVSVVALTLAGMRCSVRVLSALGRWGEVCG